MAHIEISKTSSAEFISHQLLKFVVNPNPMAALVNGFCDYLNLLRQNYDNEVTLVHLWQLQPCGLVDKISAQEFESLYKSRGNLRMRHPEGVFLYKRTGLGNSFLNFIVNGMPEENSKYNDTK